MIYVKHSDRNTKKIDVDQLPLETPEDENNDDNLWDDSEKPKSKIKNDQRLEL